LHTLLHLPSTGSFDFLIKYLSPLALTSIVIISWDVIVHQNNGTQDFIVRLFGEMDLDESKAITYEEFLAFVKKRKVNAEAATAAVAPGHR
jgi:hypothetical protein